MNLEKQKRVLLIIKQLRYTCSKDGTVYSRCYNQHKHPSDTQPKVLVQNKIWSGYSIVKLSDGIGGFVYPSVHQFIWLYFNGPYDSRLQINHKNGIRDDNKLSNLELVTASENKKHGFRIGLSTRPIGEKSNNAKLTEKDVLEIRRLYANQIISRNGIKLKYGISDSHVSGIVNRRYWKHI